ncbi:hypothetical protein [Ruegeria arenilitoris]|uniref:hypothetical protein n=1 Tax=Ruegeria arenilitoris TaxID=1173585 RepID=UPI00147F5B8F|nr:hypothetical protein [Ruegeria arenilitoris]
MNTDDFEIKRALDSSHRELVELLGDILDHLKRVERNEHALLGIFAAAVETKGRTK